MQHTDWKFLIALGAAAYFFYKWNEAAFALGQPARAADPYAWEPRPLSGFGYVPEQFSAPAQKEGCKCHGKK